MNKCGSLDHTRADPTAEEKSQYRIGDGKWTEIYVMNDYLRYAIAISHREIASGAVRGEGLTLSDNAMKRYGNAI